MRGLGTVQLPPSHIFQMTKLDFETIVQQETAYLKKIHPTPEDIPSCMQLFDLFLSCNGAFSCSFAHTFVVLKTYSYRRKLPSKVFVQVWAYGGMRQEIRGSEILHE